MFITMNRLRFPLQQSSIFIWMEAQSVLCEFQSLFLCAVMSTDVGL